MVTLRRDVKTESERYGGYNTGLSDTMTNYDRFRLATEDRVENSEYDAKFYDDSEEYKSYLWQELQRTSPRRILTPEEVKSGVTVDETADYTVEPSYTQKKEIASSVSESYKSKSRDDEKAQGLTVKAKVLLVAYALIVAVFLAIIAVNANSLAVLNGKIAALEAAQVEVGASEVVDDVTEAPESGLVFGTGSEATLENAVHAGDYELLSVGAPVSYELSENWFDAVCDWLGSIVGG